MGRGEEECWHVSNKRNLEKASLSKTMPLKLQEENNESDQGQSGVISVMLPLQIKLFRFKKKLSLECDQSSCFQAY